jgi:NhaA family Na+:H+ antiporter
MSPGILDRIMTSHREETPLLELPAAPIDRIIQPFTRFLHVQAAGGIVLLLATIAALVLANSPWSDGFLKFWKTPVGFTIGGFEMNYYLQHWINDGLMVLFFFVVGLEVKRELVLGELREMRRAALPIAAAIGGMVVPAGIYLALQYGKAGERGWGIPMATDIAFVVGCMAVLGSRFPHGLRIMLLSLAIADDIGAIVVIALGYTEGLNWWALAGAGVGLIFVWVLARLGVRSFLTYLVLGLFVWLGFHESGIHATIAGVILGLMTPARNYVTPATLQSVLNHANDILAMGDFDPHTHRLDPIRQVRRASREIVSPLVYLEHTLNPWVAFLILPLFALANAGVRVQPSDLTSPIAIAVLLGLLIGKPVGILVASWLAVRLRIASLPDGVNWVMLVGGGLLCGIGFTMALFVASLALEGSLLDQAKIGVLAGSITSAVLGMTMLSVLLRSATPSPAGKNAH